EFHLRRFVLIEHVANGSQRFLTFFRRGAGVEHELDSGRFFRTGAVVRESAAPRRRTRTVQRALPMTEVGNDGARTIEKRIDGVRVVQHPDVEGIVVFFAGYRSCGVLQLIDRILCAEECRCVIHQVLPPTGSARVESKDVAYFTCLPPSIRMVSPVMKSLS